MVYLINGTILHILQILNVWSVGILVLLKFLAEFPVRLAWHLRLIHILWLGAANKIIHHNGTTWSSVMNMVVFFHNILVIVVLLLLHMSWILGWPDCCLWSILKPRLHVGNVNHSQKTGCLVESGLIVVYWIRALITLRSGGKWDLLLLVSCIKLENLTSLVWCNRTSLLLGRKEALVSIAAVRPHVSVLIIQIISLLLLKLVLNLNNIILNILIIFMGLKTVDPSLRTIQWFSHTSAGSWRSREKILLVIFRIPFIVIQNVLLAAMRCHRVLSCIKSWLVTDCHIFNIR